MTKKPLLFDFSVGWFPKMVECVIINWLDIKSHKDMVFDGMRRDPLLCSPVL